MDLQIKFFWCNLIPWLADLNGCVQNKNIDVAGFPV